MRRAPEPHVSAFREMWKFSIEELPLVRVLVASRFEGFECRVEHWRPRERKFMLSAFLSILLLVISLFLMFIILLQRGRGGGLTGALGGLGGQSAFGTKAGDVFTRITVIVALIWVVLNCAAIFANRAESDRPYSGRSGAPDAAAGAGAGGALREGEQPGAGGGAVEPGAGGAAKETGAGEAGKESGAQQPEGAAKPEGEKGPATSEPAAKPEQPAPDKKTEAPPATDKPE